MLYKYVLSGLFGVGLLLAGWGCATSKSQSIPSISLPPIEIAASASSPALPPYQESPPKVMDLVHTSLDLRFNYDSLWVLGKATLTLKPHFYAVNEFTLDARSFRIGDFRYRTRSTAWEDVSYDYDGNEVHIRLPQAIQRGQELMLYMEYTAQPYAREASGSAAIHQDRGLYFINPQKQDPEKPRQIWTQGETQSNSGWFPTLDRPNQKTTQDIKLTVDTSDVTLSNGVMVYSIDNGDGTRTDYWKQDLPHAPYLVALAIGPWTVVKDHWRDLEVNYYVEPQYADAAYRVWGKTPRMLEFFSEIFGREYPWEKYAQVVTRDFVSGAMENTSASIFFEGMNLDHRDYLDITHEDIIAHEAAHQWFGDLVTLESWSNLPLNEGFASYAEYLWFEHEFGKDFADYTMIREWRAYLREARNSKKPLIRYRYYDRESMFDRHSYQKGSWVLHHLRHGLGDEAFFEGIKLYLNRHAFGTVEIHDLRLAFEEVCGWDLSIFFDQWFMQPGHPQLQISSHFSPTEQKFRLQVRQVQDTLVSPVYRFPLQIKLAGASGVEDIRTWIIGSSWDTIWNMTTPPRWVQIDPEHTLPAEIYFPQGLEQLGNAFKEAPDGTTRYKALEQAASTRKDSLYDLIELGLRDEFYPVRTLACSSLPSLKASELGQLTPQLTFMAMNDTVAEVRAASISYGLAALGKENGVEGLLESALEDSAWSVVTEALRALSHMNSPLALNHVRENEWNKSTWIMAKAEVLSRQGNARDRDWFASNFQKLSGRKLLNFSNPLTDFIIQHDSEGWEFWHQLYKDRYAGESSRYVKYALDQSCLRLSKELKKPGSEAFAGLVQ